LQSAQKWLLLGMMQHLRKFFPTTPLDRIDLCLRALYLTALPLVATHYDALSKPLVSLLIAWLAVTMVQILLSRRAMLSGRFGHALGLMDIGFGLSAIALTGLLASPFWWCLLPGITGMVLRHGWQKAGFLLLFALGGAATLSIFGSRAGAAAILPISMHLGAAGLSGVLLIYYGREVRRADLGAARDLQVDATQIRSAERERAREIIRAATALNATMDYERVLDMVLELSMQAIADADLIEAPMVSALLLYKDSAFRVVSARRLHHADRNIPLPGKRGILAEVLHSGGPVLSKDLSQEPELDQWVALQECKAALCLPLIDGSKSFGALLYAHPDRRYFKEERVEMLKAIAEQAFVAIQNARLYQILEEENERITEIQEEARKRFARDLHDGPTQTVAAIAMQLNFIRRLMQRDAKTASDELLKVEHMARNTTREIRHMLFTMRPLILESQGLVAALYQLARKLGETHKQRVLVDAEPDVVDSMDMGRQGVIFYIAEEAINNARKHAEAEHIWVSLIQRGNSIVLEVQDDGVGFNIGAVDADYAQRGSLGIVNMRERAELVNGVLDIRSEDGKGTCVSLVVPLLGDTPMDVNAADPAPKADLFM
jgi:signal transduction histidine kinase